LSCASRSRFTGSPVMVSRTREFISAVPQK
jgi:hypothetical protein